MPGSSRPAGRSGAFALAIAIAIAVTGMDPVLGAQAPAAATPAVPALPAPQGALGELDQLFLDSYQAASDFTKTNHSPVVIWSGSTMTLQVAGQPGAVMRVIPDTYHALKAVAHFPFAAYLRLRPEQGKPLSPGMAQVLQNFVAREAPARAHLAAFNLTPEQLRRQHAILDATLALLRETLRDARIAKGRVDAFAKEVGPLLAENTRDAGCLQVQAMHAQIRRWQAAWPAGDWGALTVVNRGSHQARYRNAATQYFGWLLGSEGPNWRYPGESLRVVFAETMFQRDQPMDLFATVVLDAEASKAFFGDEWRLSEDVLSEGAAQCIAQLSPAERIVR